MRSHSPMRPIVIVLTLLLAASLGCSITTSQARFEDAKLYKSPADENSTRSFKPDETVYCIMTIKDMDDDLPLRVVWIYLEEHADESITNITIAQEERAVSNGPVALELEPPTEGWPRGKYQAMLYLDGKHKATLPFSIK